MYFNRRCKITFICNGATIYSEDDRFTDTENYPPLNDAGQEEIEKICDVTHKDIIKAAICLALDIPASSLHRIYIKSGSATQISYYEKWASLVYSDYTPL